MRSELILEHDISSISRAQSSRHISTRVVRRKHLRERLPLAGEALLLRERLPLAGAHWPHSQTVRAILQLNIWARFSHAQRVGEGVGGQEWRGGGAEGWETRQTSKRSENQ